jgi:CMP-N,N'-diacetyllegionaminic acid synthase
MRILAVIPARGGSKRLVGKNVKLLLGKPLIGWSIEFALNSGLFSEIHVSTDCQRIAGIAASFDADPKRLRPSALASDAATSLDVIIDALDWYEQKGEIFDCVALLQPTTPVRFVDRWVTAIDYIKELDCDAVIGVREAVDHPYLTYAEGNGSFLQAYCRPNSASARSQDLPMAYCVNGALYLIKVDEIRRSRTFCPPRTRPIACNLEVENIDIDTEEDWRLAEQIMKSWIVACEQ